MTSHPRSVHHHRDCVVTVFRHSDKPDMLQLSQELAGWQFKFRDNDRMQRMFIGIGGMLPGYIPDIAPFSKWRLPLLPLSWRHVWPHRMECLQHAKQQDSSICAICLLCSICTHVPSKEP